MAEKKSQNKRESTRPKPLTPKAGFTLKPSRYAKGGKVKTQH